MIKKSNNLFFALLAMAMILLALIIMDNMRIKIACPLSYKGDPKVTDEISDADGLALHEAKYWKKIK